MLSWSNSAKVTSRCAYERRADVHETFLALGCALITWRYLKREI
jgi:hypothetical protein